MINFFLFNSNNIVLCIFMAMIFLPLLIFFIPQGHSPCIENGNKPTDVYFPIAKSYAIFISFLFLLWSLYMWCLFDASGHTLQMVVVLDRLHLSFGVDSVSLPLSILTCFLFPICLMLMRTRKGLITFLLLEAAIFGALNVLDLLGFYILFESSLILLFILIGRTPYGNIDAAYRIVLYTMAGSLILLPIIFVLYAQGGSTSLLYLMCSFGNDWQSFVEDFPLKGNDSPSLLPERQLILGWGLFLVFAVKIPLMPVHLWLPEAHVAAPTAGSVLLAGVLLKLGGIGFIRFMIPILPTFTASIFPLVCCMCLASFLFSTLSTIRQIDLKKIVAYSSIGHMAMITLAIFSMSEYSAYNATFMMVAHGLVSPCLFLLVGLLYDRYHTKYLLYFTGLGAHMPIFSLFFFLCTLANLSFPLTMNFIGEFLCLTSIFSVHSLYAYIFCICQVLGTTAFFWTFNRIIHGYSNNSGCIGLKAASAQPCQPLGKAAAFRNDCPQHRCDLSRLEYAMIIPMVVSFLWLGVKPMA
jgi:proton-translocating NADH-quinone oxidoreductase chain M